MVVQKYGGTSVATTEKILKVAESVSERLKEEKKMIVVVSAMSGETDALVALSKNVALNPQKREVDQLVSIGENKTSSLMALALKNMGVQAVSLTGWQAGIITTEQFSAAKINKINLEKLKESLKKHDVVVVAGFQGVTENGDITTLGKGGSDTTALALSAVMNCDCEVFTDVCGVFSADPKIVKHAKKIDFLSYDELMEMSACGAKVMETRSVEIAKKFGISLWISQSLRKKDEGTRVGFMEEKLESACIKNVTSLDEVTYFEICCEYKFLKIIVDIIAKISQKLDMFEIKPRENDVNICFIVEKKNVGAFLEEIKNLVLSKDVEIVSKKTLTKITLVGSGFRTHSGILSDVIRVLKENQIKVFMAMLSEISIGVLILPEYKNLAINSLCENFSLTSNKIKLAIVGASGMVGRTFLKVLDERQIKDNICELVLFASEKSAGKTLEFRGQQLVVQELNVDNIKSCKVDYAFFSAGEGISKQFAKAFVESGAVVIDNSSAFRMERDVPLIVPEVNYKNTKSKIISNPNCSTIQVVLPLNALKKFEIARIDYVTYQAVSGSGNKGVEDLKRTQNGENPKFYPCRIYNNCLPHIGSFLENGYTTEEMKMINETKKILGLENVEISATCVRVSVENCHCVEVSVKLMKRITKVQILEALKAQENVVIFDEEKYPVCDDACGQDKVLVGRIRQDLFNPCVWHFWCVADNIRKGAATNGVQILEKLLKN